MTFCCVYFFLYFFFSALANPRRVLSRHERKGCVGAEMRPVDLANEPAPAQPLSQEANVVATYFTPIVSVVVRLSRGHAAKHVSNRRRSLNIILSPQIAKTD